MKFSDWLNQEMARRKWIQSDLARQSGLTRQAISHLLGGRSKSPDPDTLLKIAKAFNISVEQIYRHANLLPEYEERDELTDQAVHIFKQIPTQEMKKWDCRF